MFMLQALGKPEVQAAMADCNKNPGNIFKYRNNPDIVMVSSTMSLGACLHICVCAIQQLTCNPVKFSDVLKQACRFSPLAKLIVNDVI